MNLLKILISFFFVMSLYAQELPSWTADILYTQNGSCEQNNLSFNAARFSKIPLNKTRDGLDLYLQMILFLKSDQTAVARIMEVGLVGCQSTKDGEVCSYRPYADTKTIINFDWKFENNQFEILGLGTISHIRDDYPWLGYELSIDHSFPIEVVRNLKIIGGKVQVNYNHLDQNVSRICNK